MKYILMVLMFFAVVAEADTLRVWYGAPVVDTAVVGDSIPFKPGYDHLDSCYFLHTYGNSKEVLMTIFDSITTTIDTYFVITGTGEHEVVLVGVYDGYPGEWYDVKKWGLILTIGTDLSGAGGYAVTVYAVDTSSTDDTVSGVAVTAKDMTGTEKGHVTTLTDGSATFNLDSGSYVFSSRTVGGYVWAFDTAIVIATDTILDSTLWGYNIAIGAPSGDSLCRVYGYTYSPEDGSAVKDAVITWSLKGRNIYDVCNGTIIVKSEGSTTSDDNGLWTLDLLYSQCLQRSSTASTSDSILYEIVVSYPSGIGATNKSFNVPSADSVAFTW